MRHRLPQRILTVFGYDFTTYYCATHGGHYPASHFPCE